MLYVGFDCILIMARSVLFFRAETEKADLSQRLGDIVKKRRLTIEVINDTTEISSLLLCSRTAI
jgi:hypothetical protein